MRNNKFLTYYSYDLRYLDRGDHDFDSNRQNRRLCCNGRTSQKLYKYDKYIYIVL